MRFIAEILGETGSIYFVFGLIVALVILLYKEVFSTAVTFLVAISILAFSGILSTSDILNSFANEQVAVIVMLLVVGKLLKRTRAIENLFEFFFSGTKSYLSFLAKMTGFVSVFSGFMNNTPLVALLLPYVTEWGRKHNIAPSKLLMPLSFAAIMGGGLTLIGTATNLIVNNILVDTYGASKGLDMFSFFWIGLPLVITGILYMLLFGNKLLPNHTGVLANFNENSREYLVDLKVGNNSSLIGKSIEEAELRNLNDLYLVEIVRTDKVISPAGPKEIIRENDYLIFAGETAKIVDLVDSNLGLELPNDLKSLKDKKEVVEVIIPFNSSLARKKIKDTNFRGKFDAAIIAVRRDGEKLFGKLGEITLKKGDMLLCVAGNDFTKRLGQGNNLTMVSNVKELKDITGTKAIVLIGACVLAILFPALDKISLFNSLILLFSFLLIAKVVRFNEIKKALNINLIVIMAGALAIGLAMKETGGAQLLAGTGLKLLEPLGLMGVLAGIYILTNLLAAYITNIAAVSIVLPIALSYAEAKGLDIMPFVMTVAFAGSKNFITPIGYQTNLMVYGPGGYSFKDYMKFGSPLTVLFLIVTIFIIDFIYL